MDGWNGRNAKTLVLASVRRVFDILNTYNLPAIVESDQRFLSPVGRSDQCRPQQGCI